MIHDVGCNEDEGVDEEVTGERGGQERRRGEGGERRGDGMSEVGTS